VLWPARAPAGVAPCPPSPPNSLGPGLWFETCFRRPSGTFKVAGFLRGTKPIDLVELALKAPDSGRH